MAKNQFLFSIVVTTKNEEKNIASCLESIQFQTYPQEKIEIIVVDNNSIDRTKEIAKRYTDLVFNKGPERSKQRNFGILEKAHGKYLIYLDADMILSSSLIEKAVEKLEQENLIALYVPEIVLGDSFWSKARRFERSFYDGTVIDCVRVIRKDAFQKTGGFDLEMTGPEDWDFDKKIRNLGKVALVDQYNFEQINKSLRKINFNSQKWVAELTRLHRQALIYHNEIEFDFKKYLTKKVFYSKSFDVYRKKWGEDDPDVKKQFSLWYRYFKVFLENKRWQRLARHLLLFLGVFFLRFIVGVIFVYSRIKKQSAK